MRPHSTSARKNPTQKPVSRQTNLLKEIQLENLMGGWEWEPGSNYFFWTDSMFILHGLAIPANNNILIETANQSVHPDDVSFVAEQFEKLQSVGDADYYFRIITSEGNIRRLHAKAKMVTTANGERIFRGSYQDEAIEKDSVQPLKDLIANQQLQISLLERAEQIALSGTWTINLNTQKTYYSDNVFRLHGILPQSLPSHPDTFTRFIHSDDRNIVAEIFEKAFRERIPLHLEYRIIKNDGATRHLQLISSIIKNSDDEQMLCGITQDITERKDLEIQLRNSSETRAFEKQLLNLIEQKGIIGSWHINLSTRQIYYSDNVYKLYGLKPQSAKPGIEAFINLIHPDDRNLIVQTTQKIFGEHLPPDIEYRIVRPDKKVRILTQKARLTTIPDGDLVMIGVIRDITEQRNLKQQLSEASRKLVIQNLLFSQTEKNASIGSWSWNLNTGEINYSDNIYTIYGLKPQSLQPGYQNFSRFMHPDDRAWMKDIPEKIKTELQPLTVNYRIIRPNGDLRYLRGRNEPIVSPEGHTVILGTTQDITEEVLFEERFIERMRFAETLGDTISDTIIVTDDANNIIWCNSRCEQIYSFKKAEVSGKNFFEIFPQFKVTQIVELLKNALKGETTHIRNFEFRNEYFEYFMSPFPNQNETVTGVLHVLHNTTEQFKLKTELQQRLEFIEKLVESSADRIFVTDQNMNYLLWNKKCEEYYSLTKEEVIGKNILDLFPHVRLDSAFNSYKKALKGETIYVPPKLDGATGRYHDAWFIPLKNERGEVTSVIWIIHDLTERILVEQKLQCLEDEISKKNHALQNLNETLRQKNLILEKMNEEQDTFASLASHNLHEPLRKIQFFSSKVVEKEAQNLDETSVDYLRRMQAAVDRMDKLIDNIISFSRLTNIASNTNEEIDLNVLLEIVKNNLSSTIANSNAIIESGPLPVIRGNLSQFILLFENLLSNSIKFKHPERAPHIKIQSQVVDGWSIRHHNVSGGLMYRKISIADNGIGFNQEDTDKIFQIFKRLHGSAEYPGGGIGLSICKRIVENLNGFIAAEGTPGNGAVFVCYLPLHETCPGPATFLRPNRLSEDCITVD